MLTLINDIDYEEGLEKIRYDLAKNPNKTIVTDFAELFCIAKKSNTFKHIFIQINGSDVIEYDL